jgi:hypothetical protein
VADPLVGLLELFDRKLAVGGGLDGTSTLEVVMRRPEVFVRPFSHEEAVRLKRRVKRSKHASTRMSQAGFDGGFERRVLCCGEETLRSYHDRSCYVPARHECPVAPRGRARPADAMRS